MEGISCRINDILLSIKYWTDIDTFLFCCNKYNCCSTTILPMSLGWLKSSSDVEKNSKRKTKLTIRIDKYLVIIHQSSKHDNCRAVILDDHFPEILVSMLKWTLRGYKLGHVSSWGGLHTLKKHQQDKVTIYLNPPKAYSKTVISFRAYQIKKNRSKIVPRQGLHWYTPVLQVYNQY